MSEGLTHQCSRQSCLFSCQSSKRGASEGHGGSLVLPGPTVECPVHPSPFRQGGHHGARCWKAARKYHTLHRTKTAHPQLLGCSLRRATYTQPQVDSLQSHENNISSRFAPPQRRSPLNDGGQAFDASLLRFILSPPRCPQVRISFQWRPDHLNPRWFVSESVFLA